MANTEELELDSLLDSALEGFAAEAPSRCTETPGTSTPRVLEPGLGKGLPSLELSKRNKAKPRSETLSKASEALEKLAEQTRSTVKSFDAPNEDEAFMENMAKHFDSLGTQDIESIMGTFMQQILSKDVLHEPMKEICARYPPWLESNRDKLSSEDFDRYSKQHKLIIQLCRVFEETPENFQKVVDLMQDMQSCGQPPSEIVQELAPDLQLGEDGMPMLANFSGAEGAPENCSIM